MIQRFAPGVINSRLPLARCIVDLPPATWHAPACPSPPIATAIGHRVRLPYAVCRCHLRQAATGAWAGCERIKPKAFYLLTDDRTHTHLQPMKQWPVGNAVIAQSLHADGGEREPGFDEQGWIGQDGCLTRRIG